MKHLKEHIMFYLGLVQLIAGWLAETDFSHVSVPAIALAASGLLTMVGRYVQSNLPEEEEIPIPPVKPAQLAGEEK